MYYFTCINPQEKLTLQWVIRVVKYYKNICDKGVEYRQQNLKFMVL